MGSCTDYCTCGPDADRLPRLLLHIAHLSLTLSALFLGETVALDFEWRGCRLRESGFPFCPTVPSLLAPPPNSMSGRVRFLYLGTPILEPIRAVSLAISSHPFLFSFGNSRATTLTLPE
jgi:hypothetical protein